MKKIRRLLNRFGLGRAIALVLLVDLVLLRIWDPLPVEALRLRTFDLYQLIQPRIPAQKPVVIVDLDEDSMKAHGQWPWPRTLVADMVTRLARAGAVAIGFDVVFAEPDRTSPAQAAEAMRGLDEETKAKLKALPSNDQVLAEAIARSRVILGQTALSQAAEAPAEPMPQTPFAVRAAPGAPADPPLVTFRGLLRNVPELENAAAGRGLFTIRPEADGIVRRVPIVMRAEETIVPSLTLDILRVVTGSGAVMIKTDQAGVASVVLRGLEIPTDGRGQLWVHFGPHDKSRFVSAKDLLAGDFPPDRFKGKLVLVGTSALGLLDLKTTPVEPAMPGVEVHAQLLESMLTKSVLTSPSYATLAELAAMALVGLAIIALAPVLGAWALFLVGGLAAALLVGLSWYYFSRLNLLIDFSFPLAATFLVYLTLVFTNYLRAHSERRQIRSAFGQYLSPVLVEQLAQSPEKLVLGGEQRDMTLLFSDVRGFTTISEQYKTDPKGLTNLMNRLLTPLTNVIIDRKGTIDKYMGDAIMAFWNAPLDDPKHEENACDAALAMIRALDGLNDERRKEAEEAGRSYAPMKVGVGINTGACVVGNMGSDLHFNYSCLGDAVNLASRLESQSKSYGVSILAGARTAETVRDRFAVLELDRLQVKGKTEPETIYTVLGRLDRMEGAEHVRLGELNDAMLAAYRGRRWQECLETILLCKEAGRAFGLDYYYQLYVERVRALIEAPPEESWNGVWVAAEK